MSDDAMIDVRNKKRGQNVRASHQPAKRRAIAKRSSAELGAL